MVGDNFVLRYGHPLSRKPLQFDANGVKPKEFKKYVNEFKDNYPTNARLLLDKPKMEKLGLSEFRDVYLKYCADEKIHDGLKKLYVFVQKCSYITEDEYADVVCAMDKETYRRCHNDFSGYEGVLQQLVSSICSGAGCSGDYTGAYRKWDDIYATLSRFCVDVSHASSKKLKDYFDCAKYVTQMLRDFIGCVYKEKLI